MTKQKIAKAKQKAPQLMIFTENLGKRILAEGFEGVTNLESFLNRTHGKEDEIVLSGVKNWYKDKSGVYRPKSERNFMAIKSDQINFIFATKKIDDSVYAPNHMPTKNKIKLPIEYGLHGLKHDLIVSVPLNKTNLPKTEKEQLLYVTKVLNGKRFIPVYNPKQRRH